MKKNLLIMALVLLFCGAAKAQNDYQPMAVEGAHWVVATWETCLTSCIKVLEEYHALGDTVVDEITYKKIYSRALQIPTPNYLENLFPPYIPKSSYKLLYLIRDDIENRKVYARILDNSVFPYSYEEFLLYDFPSNIGDIVSFELIGGDEVIIEDISFIFIPQYNKTIKVYSYKFMNIGELISYYEGIGSQFGLFEPMYTFHKSTRGGGTILIQHCLDTDDTCNGLFVSLEDYKEQKSDIRLIPNPASETVRIQLLQPESITGFQVCNLYGNVLYTQTTGDKTEYRLDTGNLAAGTYLVYFYNNTQIVQVKKLLVTH